MLVEVLDGFFLVLRTLVVVLVQILNPTRIHLKLSNTSLSSSFRFASASSASTLKAAARLSLWWSHAGPFLNCLVGCPRTSWGRTPRSTWRFTDAFPAFEDKFRLAVLPRWQRVLTFSQRSILVFINWQGEVSINRVYCLNWLVMCLQFQ